MHFYPVCFQLFIPFKRFFNFSFSRFLYVCIPILKVSEYVKRRLLVPGGKTLKSGCLSLLTIRSFSARNELGLSARVWLGFCLGGSVRAIDSLSDAV
eukprot:sb/3478964/